MMRQIVLWNGCWVFEFYDRHGRLRRRLPFPNGLTTVGGNYLADTGFRGTAQSSTWYVGLISATSFTALAVADTMAAHTGWTESQAYSEAVRQTWSADAASGGIITNSTKAVFSMNADATIRGAFLTSSNTKGGTTCTLFCTGQADTDQVMSSGESLKVVYTGELVSG